MINLIIPMAGAGSRFAKEGFNIPKPLIQIHNKPFFYWGSLSITKFVPIAEIIFVILKNHIEEFNIDKEIYKYYPKAKIAIIDEILNGASYSAMQGVYEIKNNYPLVIADCDGMFLSSDFINHINNQVANIDGGLFTFYANQYNFSYAKINDDSYVCEVAEKNPISQNAICAYYFKDAKTYIKYFNKYTNIPLNKEYYISGIFNIMLENKCKILPFKTDFVLPFGTPAEYEIAQYSKLFELMR